MWLVINSVNFPESSLFCLWWYLVNDLSPSLSQPTSFLLYFLSPVQPRRVSDRAALVGTQHPARVNPASSQGQPTTQPLVVSCCLIAITASLFFLLATILYWLILPKFSVCMSQIAWVLNFKAPPSMLVLRCLVFPSESSCLMYKLLWSKQNFSQGTQALPWQKQ